MRLRPIVISAAVALLAFKVVTDPASTGHALGGVLGWLHNAGQSLASFFNSI